MRKFAKRQPPSVWNRRLLAEVCDTAGLPFLNQDIKMRLGGDLTYELITGKK